MFSILQKLDSLQTKEIYAHSTFEIIDRIFTDILFPPSSSSSSSTSSSSAAVYSFSSSTLQSSVKQHDIQEITSNLLQFAKTGEIVLSVREKFSQYISYIQDKEETGKDDDRMVVWDGQSQQSANGGDEGVAAAASSAKAACINCHTLLKFLFTLIKGLLVRADKMNHDSVTLLSQLLQVMQADINFCKATLNDLSLYSSIQSGLDGDEEPHQENSSSISTCRSIDLGCELVQAVIAAEATTTTTKGSSVSVTEHTETKRCVMASFLLGILGKCFPCLVNRQDRSRLCLEITLTILRLGVDINRILCHPLRLRHWVFRMRCFLDTHDESGFGSKNNRIKANQIPKKVIQDIVAFSPSSSSCTLSSFISPSSSSSSGGSIDMNRLVPWDDLHAALVGDLIREALEVNEDLLVESLPLGEKVGGRSFSEFEWISITGSLPPSDPRASAERALGGPLILALTLTLPTTTNHLAYI